MRHTPCSPFSLVRVVTIRTGTEQCAPMPSRRIHKKKKQRTVVSFCMLLSSTLFAIPTALLAARDMTAPALAYGLVLVSSLIYHRYYVETRGRPAPCTQIIDTAITVLATIVVMYNGNRLTRMIASSGVCTTFISQHLVNTTGDGVSLVGSAGVHSLGHVGAVIAGVSLAGQQRRISAHDAQTTGFAGLLCALLFVLFMPRLKCHHRSAVFGKCVHDEGRPVSYTHLTLPTKA